MTSVNKNNGKVTEDGQHVPCHGLRQISNAQSRAVPATLSTQTCTVCIVDGVLNVVAVLQVRFD